MGRAPVRAARAAVLALLLAASLAACGTGGHPVPGPQPGTEAVAP